MEDWKVYKHTAPNGKVYIGITHQEPKQRWSSGHGYSTNTHFFRAIKKYGWKNFKHEILATGLTQQEAEEIERELIYKYKSHDDKFGYNKALGGHALSEKSRKKIGDTRKKRGYTSHTAGKHLSEETKRKISIALTGNRNHTEWTEEQKESVRISKLGDKNPNYKKPMSEEKKQMLIALNSKPVVMVSAEGNIVFKSAKEAMCVTGINNTNITKVCRGQRLTAGGHKWFYA